VGLITNRRIGLPAVRRHQFFAPVRYGDRLVIETSGRARQPRPDVLYLFQQIACWLRRVIPWSPPIRRRPQLCGTTAYAVWSKATSSRRPFAFRRARDESSDPAGARARLRRIGVSGEQCARGSDGSRLAGSSALPASSSAAGRRHAPSAAGAPFLGVPASRAGDRVRADRDRRPPADECFLVFCQIARHAPVARASAALSGRRAAALKPRLIVAQSVTQPANTRYADPKLGPSGWLVVDASRVRGCPAVRSCARSNGAAAERQEVAHGGASRLQKQRGIRSAPLAEPRRSGVAVR
jgi:hypothetical protein